MSGELGLNGEDGTGLRVNMSRPEGKRSIGRVHNIRSDLRSLRWEVADNERWFGCRGHGLESLVSPCSK